MKRSSNIFLMSLAIMLTLSFFVNYTPNQINCITEVVNLENNLKISADTTPPIWSNLFEYSDPLEWGINQTIYIDVYDEQGTNISFVYLELRNINYSMINNTGTYYYEWLPVIFGVNYYTIWMSNDLGLITSVSGSFIVQKYSDVILQENFYTIMSVSILIFLMFLMIIVYLKFKMFLIILGICLFSIIIGAYSIVNYTIPFTPIFQSFFILFQITFLLITTNQVYSKKR